MLQAGLYIYHCESVPVPTHLANGLYGLILVEPSTPLPPVDKEFYLMRSEFYTDQPDKNFLPMSYYNGLNEQPQYVVFNGKTDSLTEKPLKAKVGDKIRIYVGNAGPNQVASFHIIGTIFSSVYREGDLVSPPAKNLQTTLIPAGGSTVVELEVPVPGTFVIVDHSIFRIAKGGLGMLVVEGPERPDIYCKYVNDTCQNKDTFDDGTTKTTTTTSKPSVTNVALVASTKGGVKNAGGPFMITFISLCYAIVGCVILGS